MFNNFKSYFLRQQMTFKAFLFACWCMSTILSMRLKVTLDSNQGPVCLYEMLQKDEKYLFRIEAETTNFRMDVMNQDNAQRNGWKEVATKMGKRISQTINKIADSSNTYTFCVSTSEPKPIKVLMEIQTKLELANFDYLPDLNDNENLNREVQWMYKQKQKIFEILNRMQGIRSSSEQFKSMMGVTMVVLAILGVIIIAAANVVFYIFAKRTLKDRKLI